MSQHDYSIANADGATVRADLNSLFEAIASLNSGNSAPSPTFSYMLWADTANTLLKLRNGANNAWIELGTLDVANLALAKLAANTFSGTQNFADNILQRPVIKDYGEGVNVIGSIGGGTQDIDLEEGNVITCTVDTSTTTFTFSNPHALGSPSAGVATSFTMKITNGGSRTVNWPTNVRWPGGTPPTLTASGVDTIVFETVDGGLTWDGYAAGLDQQT